MIFLVCIGGVVNPMTDDGKHIDRTQAIIVPGPGVNISHYHIERPLGEGGMGEVFLARDLTLERLVALKFLHPAVANDPVFRERFTREARTAAALNHPNVVTVYEVAESDERVFIALEYVEGSSLRELIDSGTIPCDTCIDIIIQICNGLQAAHQAKLIHRDIKPANIILDRDNRVRILDFGLAKGEGDKSLTQAGMTLGTISYLSPEQCQGKTPDPRSDIFALGVVFFEMLTGRAPFSGDNIPATLYSIVHDKIPSVHEIRPDVPEAIQPIMERILSRPPEQRYQTAAEFKADLIRLSQAPADATTSVSLPVSDTTVTIATPAPTPEKEAKSLAVMYIRNLGSEDDEFLCYGITEDLIVDLTRVGTMRVASMRSIMKYKDSDADLEEIARKLDVQMILDGSIHKAGDNIRISAQLVDTKSGETLWARRWQESINTLPEIQKALVDGISDALQLDEEVIEKAQIGITIAHDAHAYENYLKAKYHFSRKQDRSDVEIAQGLYALALKQEPDLLPARAGIAEIAMYNGEFGKARQILKSALEAALRLQRPADKAEVHRLFARLEGRQSRWAAAREHADAAIALCRAHDDLAGEAEALGILISILQPQARFDEAIECFDRVLEIERHLDDKERMADALKSMGVAYSRKGDYDRALSLYEEALELARPQENLSLQAACLSNIGNIHFFRGQFEDAFGHYQQALEISDTIGDLALSARQNMNMGLIKLQLGEHKQGAMLLDSAAAIFETLEDKANYAMCLVNGSQAHLTLGQVTPAIDAAKTALEIGREVKHPLVTIDALVRLGAADFYTRDYAGALKHLFEAMEMAEQAQMNRNLAHINLVLVQIFYHGRDLQKSRVHANRALSIAREIGDKTALSMANAYLGAVSACEGLFNAGRRQLRDALRSIEKINDHQKTIQLQTLLGRVLIECGSSEADCEDGHRLLKDSLETAQSLHLAPEIKTIEEYLAEQ